MSCDSIGQHTEILVDKFSFVNLMKVILLYQVVLFIAQFVASSNASILNTCLCMVDQSFLSRESTL